MVETCNCTITLKEGDESDAVKLMQTHLKTLGYYTYSGGSYLQLDGDFGPYTKSALKKFQSDCGLDGSGDFDANTCSTLNTKILAHYGVTKTVTPTDTTKTATTTQAPATTSNTASQQANYADKYKVDISKNVFFGLESNLKIQGLYLIAASVKRTQEFNGPEWSAIEMMDGTDYEYMGREKPLQYTIEVYFPLEKYDVIKSELAKLPYQVCNVGSHNLFKNGKYTVKVSVEDTNANEKKVTFDIKQYRGVV